MYASMLVTWQRVAWIVERLQKSSQQLENVKLIHCHCLNMDSTQMGSNKRINGMNITFVTTAKTDDEAYALLKALGMPLQDK